MFIISFGISILNLLVIIECVKVSLVVLCPLRQGPGLRKPTSPSLLRDSKIVEYSCSQEHYCLSGNMKERFA